MYLLPFKQSKMTKKNKADIQCKRQIRGRIEAAPEL